MAITAALWGMGCACPASPAVGHGRCVGYLFGTYYLFLLKCLVSWFYFVSLHSPIRVSMCCGTLHRGRTSVLPLLFIASVESIELFVIQRMCELSNKSQQTSICLECTSQILVLVFLPPNAPLMHAPRVNTIVFVGRMLSPLQISSPLRLMSSLFHPQ